MSTVPRWIIFLTALISDCQLHTCVEMNHIVYIIVQVQKYLSWGAWYCNGINLGPVSSVFLDRVKKAPWTRDYRLKSYIVCSFSDCYKKNHIRTSSSQIHCRNEKSKHTYHAVGTQNTKKFVGKYKKLP